MINREMFQALQPGVAALNNQRAESQRQQHQIALEKYLKQIEPELAGQKAQAVSDVDEAASKRRLDTVQGVVDDAAGKGKKVSAAMTKEGASYSENQPDPIARLMGATRNEGKALDGAAQKSVGSLTSQLQQIESMHRLLDNPSSVDAKQLGAGFARITEGQGQRLLQSLVESMGAPKDVVGDSTKALSFLTASATSPIGSEQHKAMRQNLFKHQAALQDQLDQGHQQFLQRGGLLAPDLDSSKYETAWSSAAPPAQLTSGLKSRQDAFNKESGATPQKGLTPQMAQPQSLLDKYLSPLRNAIGGGQSAPTAQPQQGPQAGKIKVRRKADGATGTMDASDPALKSGVYEQVQ